MGLTGDRFFPILRGVLLLALRVLRRWFKPRAVCYEHSGFEIVRALRLSGNRPERSADNPRADH